ncbi:MAG: tryptophan synthase subunit alpha [Acidobacteria bacterium]|nr:MAG: tryptophan synthase subunit alpha [Acidobacteriota bacterium]
MKKQFYPYLLANYPSISQFETVLHLTAEYADAIEIGIPFSDPVADGPVIREAAEKVLKSGFELESVFRILQNAKLRIPVALMTYANPVLAYGRDRAFKACAECGVKFLIVPDVPHEESEPWRRQVNSANLKWIQFVSLVTRAERLRHIARSAEGFIYLVSLTGITGAKIRGPEAVSNKAREIKQVTDVPVALGFGIKTPQDVLPYRNDIDAFIVGSRIVELSTDINKLKDFYIEFRHALEGLS